MDLDFANLKMSTKPKIVWSEQQMEVFHWADDKSGLNLVVVARAGTGKSTVIIHFAYLAWEKHILVVAFNKDIERHMTEHLKTPAGKKRESKTLHSLGFMLCRGAMFGKCTIAKGADIAYERARKAIENWINDEGRGDSEAIAYLKRETWLVVKLSGMVKGMEPFAKTVDEVFQVMEEMELDIAPARRFPQRTSLVQWPHINDVVCNVVVRLLKIVEAEARTKFKKEPMTIDFDDMCWLPVRCGWLRPIYDMVIVDEAQDMNKTQLELSRGVCKKSGRMMIVGDPAQAIYGFRGADSSAISRMTDELQALELPLSYTFRCPKVVVEEANRFVKDFHAAENAPLGIRKRISVQTMLDMVGPDDFILSRVNAPLMSICLRLITKGKRATVKGVSIGIKLVNILKQVAGKTPFKDKGDMWARLQNWGANEKMEIVDVVKRKYHRCKDKKIKAEIKSRQDFVNDQLGIFSSLIREMPTPQDVVMRLETLFSDPDLDMRSDFVVCSSIHKAKGLERKRVFVLVDTLRSDDDEERNLSYVALTRTKSELYLVEEAMGSERLNDDDDELYTNIDGPEEEFEKDDYNSAYNQDEDIW